ncbi:helix-turn-helix transcriptional regulator [Domibacillus indicus]|uniref:helix-turn-helix transcriptional regulator n=1 Tax=Domibacillus indicus TaxID=1437523 RepID=UPI0006971157|nr:YafY family protein [Domibacillus indicus]
MKTERMLSILIYLLKRNIVPAEELAEVFEVSTRTIYRDMDALSSIGIPVISYLGKNGGFGLIDTYRLDKFTFSDEEKTFLLEGLALQNELFDRDQLAVLQRKLELLKGNQEEHHSAVTVFSSTLHREAIEKETKEKVNKILSVITEEARMRIYYVSQAGSPSSRIVQPFKLNFLNGSWYVEAFCEWREAVRSFKLTRIRKIEIIRGPFEAVYVKKQTYPAEQPAEKEEIALVFSKSELGKLYDFFTDDEIKVLEDERVKVVFQHRRDSNLLPFLLMFGRHVSILYPAWLEKKYKEEIGFIYKS